MANQPSSLSSKRGNLAGLWTLARPGNVAIAAATFLLLKFGWLARWDNGALAGNLTGWPLVEGMLVVALLMTSGNWINAYFDVQEDRINRPDRALVGRSVKRRVLIVAHQVVNGAGLLIAAHLSWTLQTWTPLWMAGGISYILWQYSARWKSTPLFGNVAVAALLGMVPLWLAALEATMASDVIRPRLWVYLSGYGALAMGVGLVRELAKDAMDIEGDRLAGKHTLAVRRGESVIRSWCIRLLLTIAVGYAGGVLVWSNPLHEAMLWMAPLPFCLHAFVVLSRPNPKWSTLSRSMLLTLMAGGLQCLWIPV